MSMIDDYDIGYNLEKDTFHMICEEYLAKKVNWKIIANITDCGSCPLRDNCPTTDAVIKLSKKEE